LERWDGKNRRGERVIDRRLWEVWMEECWGWKSDGEEGGGKGVLEKDGLR
jgi:hypothetical protein